MIEEKEEEKVEAQETVELVGEDYKDRDDSEQRDEEETSPIPEGQLGRFRMESQGYARNFHRGHPTLAECRS